MCSQEIKKYQQLDEDENSLHLPKFKVITTGIFYNNISPFSLFMQSIFGPFLIRSVIFTLVSNAHSQTRTVY